jgi:cytochrome c peroxidase
MSRLRRCIPPALALLVFSSAVTSQEASTPTKLPVDIIAAADIGASSEGVGNASVFVRKYLTFRSQQLRSKNPNLLTIPLGYVKGLSTSFTGAAGTLSIDLQTGEFKTDLSGLKSGESFSVLLIERNVDQEATITKSRTTILGTATAVSSTTLTGTIAAATGAIATITGNISKVLAGDFSFDRVAIVRKGETEQVAAGSVNVFQKIFYRRLSLKNAEGVVLFKESTTAPLLARLVPSVRAGIAAEAAAELSGIDTTSLNMKPQVEFKYSDLRNLSSQPKVVRVQTTGDDGLVDATTLINQGSKFFFEKTFSGNGRTCGTCHPKENNFTIDVPFIASRPANDPLFVAEFNPALALLERPTLMRQFGLILENVDGLDNPAAKFVMRSVPHTLGLQTSLTPIDPTQLPTPAAMTGWSGDGAPNTGSLRDFATGAVTQHFTKSLNRFVNQDFKLPNEHQLDAMEAFQLSLGRENDFNLAAITFADANIESGKQIFLNGTGDPNAGNRCTACHVNAGALAANGNNRNFNTNVEDKVHPGQSVQAFPHDGGFGQTPNVDGTFGNRAFNTPTVVEAADTEEFFHNNVVTTLEGVVEFYGGPEFNGPRAPAGRFSFDPTQVTNMANFMRAINTLQNIDVAQRELNEILAFTGNPQKEVATRLASAFEDTDDGIRVLNQTSIYPTAATALISARSKIAQAQVSTNKSQRNSLISQAVAQLTAARGLIAS